MLSSKSSGVSQIMTWDPHLSLFVGTTGGELFEAIPATSKQWGNTSLSLRDAISVSLDWRGPGWPPASVPACLCGVHAEKVGGNGASRMNGWAIQEGRARD